MSRPYTLIALSGSLRRASTNTNLLRAAQLLAPAGLSVALYEGLGQLPLFNPDLDDAPPAQARDFRAALAASDGVLIASPEYAHGVSGVIKNALDWAVGWEEFYGKPVALLNAAPRAHIALAALRETLETMSAWMVDAACVAVPVQGPRAEDPPPLLAQADEIALPLRQALNHYLAALQAGRPSEWGRHA